MAFLGPNFVFMMIYYKCFLILIKLNTLYTSNILLSMKK